MSVPKLNEVQRRALRSVARGVAKVIGPRAGIPSTGDLFNSSTIDALVRKGLVERLGPYQSLTECRWSLTAAGRVAADALEHGGLSCMEPDCQGRTHDPESPYCDDHANKNRQPGGPPPRTGIVTTGITRRWRSKPVRGEEP